MVTKSDNSVIDFKFNSSSFIKLFLNLIKFLLNLFSLFIGQTCMVKRLFLDKSLWSHDLTTLYTCIVHFCTQPTPPLLYPCICLLAGRTLSKCGENIVYLWGELLSSGAGSVGLYCKQIDQCTLLPPVKTVSTNESLAWPCSEILSTNNRARNYL